MTRSIHCCVPKGTGTDGSSCQKHFHPTGYAGVTDSRDAGLGHDGVWVSCCRDRIGVQERVQNQVKAVFLTVENHYDAGASPELGDTETRRLKNAACPSVR